MLRVPHGAFHGSARAYLRSSPRHDRPFKDHTDHLRTIMSVYNDIMVVSRRKKNSFHFWECLGPKTIHNVPRHTILSIYIAQCILL